MEGLEGGAGAAGEEVPVEDHGAPVGGSHIGPEKEKGEV